MRTRTSDPLLRTRQVAVALGVSVSTIKRWVDCGELAATRTLGNHRLIPLSLALRFARRRGLPQDALLALVETHVESFQRVLELEPLVEELVTTLCAGHTARAKAMLRALFATGMGASVVGDQVIRPVMDRLGHDWQTGTLDVFQEHEASQVIISCLVTRIERLSLDLRPSAPLALGAAPAGDPYTLALLLGELVLREAGWNVRNLGSNLPLRSLAQAVTEYRPRLVFLTASHLTDPDAFTREYEHFYATAESHGVAVIVGGRALDSNLRARLNFARCGGSMSHLAEFGRHVLSTTVATERGGATATVHPHLGAPAHDAPH